MFDPETANPKNRKPASLVMRSIGTLAVLAACLFVILWGGYDPNSKNWAFGTVGTILGFWLKASR